MQTGVCINKKRIIISPRPQRRCCITSTLPSPRWTPRLWCFKCLLSLWKNNEGWLCHNWQFLRQLPQTAVTGRRRRRGHSRLHHLLQGRLTSDLSVWEAGDVGSPVTTQLYSACPGCCCFLLAGAKIFKQFIHRFFTNNIDSLNFSLATWCQKIKTRVVICLG